jgi:hypothetical protein
MGNQEHALQLFCRHLRLFSSSALPALGIAGMLEEAAGLQRHSDEDSCNLSSKDRYAKLPAMPTKRKKNYKIFTIT